MNRTYRSVWSEASKTWVAAPETATARGRCTRRLAVLAGAALGLAAGVVATPARAAANGNGSLELCQGANGWSWGNTGGSEALNCLLSTSGKVDGVSFSLNNNGDGKGGYGFDGATARVTGYVDGRLTLKGLNVVVNGPATFDSLVTMSDQRITRLAPAELSDTSTDAVNGSQLYTTNEAVGENTTSITNLIRNIERGAIGLVQQDPASGNITVGRDTDGVVVDLTGTAGTRQLSGLANGTHAQDAVNVAQLQSAGFMLDSDGNVRNPAVAYTPDSIASGKPTIVLAPGTGDSRYFRNGNRQEGLLPAGTVISNVADGIVDTDAANIGQVYDIVGQSQLNDTAHSTNPFGAKAFGATAFAAALPGAGSGVDSSGLNTTYRTAAYYSQVAGLGDSTGSTPPSDVARANAAGAVAIGSNALTTGSNGAALGVQAYTPASDAVALGAGSVANEANTVSVGNDGTRAYTAYDANGQPYTIDNPANTRRVVNMAAGRADTDATNVGQLRSVVSVLGGGAAVNADGTFQAPTYHMQGGTQATLGDALTTLDTGLTSLQQNGGGGAGPSLVELDPASGAILVGAAVGGTSVSLAGTAGERVLDGLANGTVDATSRQAVNGSQLYGAASSIAAALGGGVALGANGALGLPAYQVGGTTVSSVGAALANLDGRVSQNSTAIAALQDGSGGTPSAPAGNDADAVHYDSPAHDQITLTSASNDTVRLTGLQDATLSTTSTDAVTGQQLYSTNQQIANLGQAVQNIGTNGTTALAANTAGGPAAATGTRSIAAGGGALASGAGSTALGDAAQASASNAVAIGANSVADRADSVSVGAAGAERQIVNVAAGAQGTDAVNLNQLNNAMTQSASVLNRQIAGLQHSIDTVEKNAYAGVAAAMAMPNLTPSGPGRTVVAAGGGYYKGSSAAAAGVTYRSENSHWLVNGAVSVTNNGNAGARAQVGYEF